MSEADGQWMSRRILILGMTYPNYSKKYRENVCTGGLFEDTREMLRIHPVPVRYMEPGQRFKNFQWITAKVMKHPSDPRPESYRIHPESITPEDEIEAKHGQKRYEILRKSPHLYQSVEALKERWNKDGTSLGIIQPKEILGCRLKYRSVHARDEWHEKEHELMNQKEFPFEKPLKRLDFPEVKFLVKWLCDDSQCQTHEMGILTWGLHELYRKYRGNEDCEQKVLDGMRKRLDMSRQEVFLFLGNFRANMHNFGLMDSYACRKQYLEPPRQFSLPGI